MHRHLVVAATALALVATHASPAAAALWGAPEIISDPGPGSVVSLAVMPDAGSDTTATWRAGAAGTPFFVERADGFWGQSDTLGAMFTNAVRLATNSAGDAVAVWDSCAQTCLYAAVREAGGDWADPVLVSGSPQASIPHYDYSAAVDLDGDATIIFKLGDVISTRTRTAGGTWAAAEPVVTDGSARARGIAVDAAGTVFALWTAAGLAGTEAKLAARPPLEAWQAPVTVAEDVSEASLLVAPEGDAMVVSRSSEGALSSRVRAADGTLGSAQAIAAGPVYSPRAAIGSGGHTVAAWEEGSEVKLATRAPDADWASPVTITAGATPVLAVDAAGNAALASEHRSDTDERSLYLQTVTAAGEKGPLASMIAATGREITPSVTVTPDGHATAVWQGGTTDNYAVRAISTNGPIGSATGSEPPPEEGEPVDQTPDGDGGQPSSQPDGAPAPSPSPSPSGPTMVDTLRTVAMPKLVGLDESAAKDAVGDAGIQARFTVALSHRKPPKGRRVGDVIRQAPRPGTQVTSGFATLLPVKLTVYAGPARGRSKCAKKVMRSLRTGLRGADLVAAERVAEKQGCYVQRNFRIADVDEAQVTAISQPGGRRNGRPIVTLTISVPSDVAKNDLFLGFRENPNQLSFAAEDWGLTASRDQRNFLTVTVKNRFAVPIPGTTAVLHGVEDGAELHFDATDVGAPTDPPVQKSDKTGQLSTSVFAPKAGTIDVIAVKTGANGLSMYGIGRLSVRDRRAIKIGGSFRTTGGRLLERSAGGWFCKEGPGDLCKLPFSYIKEGARASAFDPFGGFVNMLSSLLGSFGSGNSGVDATKGELAAGRSPLATIQAALTHRIQMVQYALTNKPLSSSAQAIAAGGGNVIAAGGGNVIAAGGGNVIAAGGGNVIAAGGGNVIAAGGGNAIAAGGGNVIAAGGGNVVRLPGGGQAILPKGGNAIAAGGGNLFPVSSAIAAGGGN